MMNEKVSDVDIRFAEREIFIPQDLMELIKNMNVRDIPELNEEVDPVAYINETFPNDESLSNLDNIISEMKLKTKEVDNQLSDCIFETVNQYDCSKSNLNQAKDSINLLQKKLHEITKKSNDSINNVYEFTHNIQKLDNAKRNISSVITSLNNLQMLSKSIETITNMKKSRCYKELISILQGMLMVAESFDQYKDIPQIYTLFDRVDNIKVDLGEQILQDFKDEIYSGNFKDQTTLENLSSACIALDTIGDSYREDLLRWFINYILSDYTKEFQHHLEVSWLTKIDRRFAWFKKLFCSYDEDYRILFPDSWEVEYMLVREFCKLTNESLQTIMTNRRNEIDAKILLFAIQKTIVFENFLFKRISEYFNCLKSMNNEESNTSDNISKISGVEKSIKDKSENPFFGSISSCFDPYLPIYLDSLEKTFSDLISRFVQDINSGNGFVSYVDKLHKNDDKLKINQHTENPLNLTESPLLPFAGELFVHYKRILVQLSQMTVIFNSPKILIKLSHLFGQFLKEFNQKLLAANIPKSSNTTFTSFLKEETALDDQTIVAICSIIVTADYCIETTQQLQDKLNEQSSDSQTFPISFVSEIDQFSTVINSSIQYLVNEVDNLCESGYQSMMKMNWNAIESVGDQSIYITTIIRNSRSIIPLLRNSLKLTKKYFTQICIKLSMSLTQKFLNNIYKIKCSQIVAFEQILLDTHSLKEFLLLMPNYNSNSLNSKIPTSYTKVVTKSISQIEIIVKTVISPLEPHDEFIKRYIHLFEDKDINIFTKILEMKAIKKSEINVILDKFRLIVNNFQSTNNEKSINTPQFSDNMPNKPKSFESLNKINLSNDQETYRIKLLRNLLKKTNNIKK